MDKMGWGKFYPKKSYPNLMVKVIHTNKSHKNFYPEVLSKNFLIQNVRDLFYNTLYISYGEFGDMYLFTSMLLYKVT